MPTTNPVPSQDPSDLLFNAGKLDEVLNGTGTSFTDRLGTARRTVAGMNADFDAQLADAESDLNVYRADAAASAAQALGYLNTIRTTSYGAYASDPATDPLGNPPNVGDEYFNTTSNLLKRFNGTTWQASDINTANLAAPSGSSLVGYDTGTVQDVLDGAKSLQDYAALRAYTGRASRIYITGLLATAKPAGIAGVFQHDSTDTTSADNGGTIIVGADGRRWKRDYSGAMNVKWFGAKGDWNGTTGNDDTAAIQAAITLAKGENGLHFPAGFYKITSTLIIATNGSSNLNLYGDSWRSRLVMVTDNTPIFKIAGMGVRISDMGLVYQNIQPVANTNAIAIAPDYMYQCFFENLYCQGAYAFIYVRPISTTYNGASNLYFSCSFKDIYIQAYSGYGFYGVGYGGGVTGNTYENIYINGQTPNRSGTIGTAIAAIALGAQDDSVFNQINIEATNLTHAISIDGISSGIVFNSVHIEFCAFTDDVLWLKNAYGITFNGIVFRGNTLAANNKSLMYVEGNVKVSINGVYEFGTNTAGFTLHRYRSTLTYPGSSIKTKNVTSNTANVITSDSLYAKSILFEGVAKIGTPGHELDIGERTDTTQKSIRVNGNINGVGNFDGLVIGTLSTGAGNQIELISNIDINNSESWRIRSAGTGGIRIAYAEPKTSYSGLSYTEKFRLNNSGELTAAADNTQTLGAAAYRWSVVYAGTGTINTSDKREKQQIRSLTDAERAVAVKIKSMIRAFKFKDAVSAKGDDARIHVGVIAQEVIAAFEAESIDPMKYAIVCYDEWGAEAEELDSDGAVLKPARDAGNRYGVRYDQLLAFIVSAL